MDLQRKLTDRFDMLGPKHHLNVRNLTVYNRGIAPCSDRAAISRRQLFALGAAELATAETLRPMVVSVQVMFDRGAHGGRGLGEREISLFRRYQEQARRQYATSGIHFELHMLEGAYLRQQGYSEIPDKFLVRNMINLFVTESLGYDIDRDRTGGCSIGPRPASRRSGGYPFYETYLGLREAHVTTLPHEYAHHFTLDTQHRPTAAGNFWADLRNDYWLWRQRHGASIPEFRACAHSPWARIGGGAAVTYFPARPAGTKTCTL